MRQRYHLDDTTKYVRDGHSKAIISTDVAGLSAYKARKNKDREIALIAKTAYFNQTINCKTF